MAVPLNRNVGYLCLIWLGLGLPFSLWGQIGGQKTFEFLNLPTNAKVAGLGGVLVTAHEPDANMFLSNPALLDSVQTDHISVNYLSYYADLKYGTIAYIKHMPGSGTWAAGLQYLSYGSFDSYDPSGAPLGQFDAADYALTLGYSHRVSDFTLGANLKWVGSQIASYQAGALLFDLGGRYHHPEKDLVVGVVFKNFGFLLSDYTDTSNGEVPFDVQVGATFKPEFMPLRFSLSIYNLGVGSGNLFTPNGDGLGPVKTASGLDRVFRHVSVGTEFIISKNVNLRAGYNHLIRRELRLQETSGGAGFAVGFLIKVKAFEMAYTKAFYHVAGGTSYVTLSSNLGKLIKRKVVK